MNATEIPLLLVDDNPVDAAVVQQMVRGLGSELPIALTWVENPDRALAELRRCHFDVVLLDYQLPGASGLDLLGRIQHMPAAQRPAVIMLTASGNESIAVQAMRQGAQDYLRKDDLDSAGLTRALTGALARQRLEAEVARFHADTATELWMAHELQQALLPQHYPRFPACATEAESALQFCHLYRPTRSLGGDFFNVFALSDTTAGLIICDVMGHGVRAALVTAMVRTLVEELRPLAGDPGKFLHAINRGLIAILKSTDQPLFATAFYLVADAATGALHYASAGHPCPFHLRRRARTVAPLPLPPGAAGPALGLFEDAAYATATGALAPDDAIIFYTDGLFETDDADGNQFGQERLLDAVRQRLAQPPSIMFPEIITAIQRFAGREEFADDVCLVSLEGANHSSPRS